MRCGHSLLSFRRSRAFTHDGRAARDLPAAERTIVSVEFVLDTPVVRAFIAEVQTVIAGAATAEQACEAIRPRFAQLLADPDWLPAGYQAAAPESGMGGGIGQWLIYRADDRSLSLFSLVVPPEAQTPVHDHLAWGLVGLYRGTQDEEIYTATD